jgi:hypothetical protein
MSLNSSGSLVGMPPTWHSVYKKLCTEHSKETLMRGYLPTSQAGVFEAMDYKI